MKSPLVLKFVVTFLLIAIMLVGCASADNMQPPEVQPSPTQTQNPPTPTITPEPTLTPTITPSPTPTLPEMFTYPFAGPVPDGALRRIGKGTYQGYDLSPDGSTLAVGTELGIYLFSALIFQLNSFFEVGSIWEVHYLPDGQTLVGLQFNSIVLINSSDGSVIKTIATPSDTTYRHISISPDGQLLAASKVWETGIDIWNISSGIKVTYLAEAVFKTIFSPDGKYLVGTTSIYPNRGKVLIWDSASWNLLYSFESKRVVWDTISGFGHNEDYLELAFSPDGNTLAAGSEAGTISLWDVRSYWKKTRTITAPRGSIKALVYSSDGQHLISLSEAIEWSEIAGVLSPTGSWADFYVWDTTNWEITASSSHSLSDSFDYYSLPEIHFSTDGAFIISDFENHLITARSQPEFEEKLMIADFSWSAGQMQFSPDGSKMLNNDALWDVASGKMIREYPNCNPVIMSPDGKILASNISPSDSNLLVGQITICDTASGEITKIIEIPAYASELLFSKDGKLLAAGLDNNTAVLWDTQTWGIKHTLTGHSDSIRSVGFSPDGTTLATGSADTTIRLWDVESGTAITTLKGLPGPAYNVLFSPDSNLIAGGYFDGRAWQGKTIIWDIESGDILIQVPAISFFFSLDGGTFAYADLEKTWHAYNTVDWSELDNFEYIDPGVSLPDGTRLTSEGGTIVFWPPVR